MGKTLIRLIITVAPQKDICPQGSTYPRKAAAIVKSMINHPLIQGPFK
jgi:hypothetical protein